MKGIRELVRRFLRQLLFLMSLSRFHLFILRILSSLFLIIVAVDFKKIDVKRAVVVFFPALLGVFLLNVVRICALFAVGIHVSREFAVGMFHANVGWIIFCAYFFLFLWFVYPWIAHRKSEKKNK
ncbi:MAG: exosortase/archaeosortase family protein [archaeon]|nr:exosortase/archaeosortase family protein [archaeon]